MSEYELYHYGIPGMKWGVRRALKKSDRVNRITRKAAKLDKKEAEYKLKAEKAHNKHDLEGANRTSVKAAKLEKQASQYKRKALKTDSEFKRTRLERKAAKLDYKAASKKKKGEAVSKSTGYGRESMRYLNKSAEYARKAAKARRTIANDKLYIEKMKRKVSSIPQAELDSGYAFCKSVLEL